MILIEHPEEIILAKGLKAIGYWRSDERPWLPNPQDFVDPDWTGTEKELVIYYLRHGHVIAQWKGFSFCRFGCLPAFDENMGSTCMADRTYVWPEGFAHYVEIHNVRPPKEFVEHVLSRIQRPSFRAPREP